MARRRGDGRSPGVLTDARLARVVEFMSANLGEPLSLDQLAGEAATSRFHFVRLFRARTGETPFAFLTRLRMDTACRLLATTDLGIGEVAATCGYPRLAHFGVAFRRRFAVSPSAYRARYQGERPRG